MSTKWIPNFIKKTINYKPKEILTAQEYNAILNLLITQGDYNSSWLEYLQNDAIPEAIADIGMAEVEQVLTAVVRQELDALAHQVINKTSVQLNNPAVTILNTGLQVAPWSDFNDLLEDRGLKATYCIATNLVGHSSAYPTLAQLQTIYTDDNDVIAYSTDGAPLTALTAQVSADAAKQYMTTNGFNTEVFIYPSGNSDSDVTSIVHNYFNYAVNINTHGTITPDNITAYSPASVLGNLAVIKCDSTIDTATIKGYIDSIVTANKYMILQVNTDSEYYDAEQFAEVLDYMLTKSSILYPASISEEMQVIHNTIGNLLDLVSGIAITEASGVKYINW